MGECIEIAQKIGEMVGKMHDKDISLYYSIFNLVYLFFHLLLF